MSLLKLEYQGRPVRVETINGEYWWVAKDVCGVLDIGNVSQALSYLDEDEKGITTNDTLGGAQKMATVNEPGLYSLILRSRKPDAKAFKRWVTHEVLPSIRKTGSYTAPKATPDVKMLQQLRLAVRDGLLEKHEARNMLGLVEYPAPDNISPKVARQVFAVARKAMNREIGDKDAKDRTPDLFT